MTKEREQRVRPDGIVFYPRREQPWTVWRGGFVVQFTHTKAEALAMLAKAKLSPAAETEGSA